MECLRKERDMLDENEDVETVVFESHHQAVLDGYGILFIGFFGIVYEAPLGEKSLFFT